MNTDINTLIADLEQHEGGALGGARIWFHTASRIRRSGISVDDFLRLLRAAERGDEAKAITIHAPGRSVSVTSANGETVDLVRVLGFDPSTFTVAIEAVSTEAVLT